MPDTWCAIQKQDSCVHLRARADRAPEKSKSRPRVENKFAIAYSKLNKVGHFFRFWGGTNWSGPPDCGPPQNSAHNGPPGGPWDPKKNSRFSFSEILLTMLFC
jgi:hypothetical protein